MASTLTLPQAKVELEKLITCGSVQYVIDGYIGVVKNNYVLFPNDNHKYRYNRDKLISNILKNKIFYHLYIMSPKSSKQNTPTISDNAIKKLQFIELMPNQEFSFLDSIGDISKETGYKDSLVITSEGFVNQAGGGVCQVSSTMYYAALHAGFPILERYNHSKAISYYAQAFDYGLDDWVPAFRIQAILS